MKNLKFYRK